jgi:hypothetical protein
MPTDCVILVADLDTENAIKGVLARPQSIGCRKFSFEIYRHPRRDPGVRLESRMFLRTFCGSCDHSVVIFDKHGSGADQLPPAQIERQIETDLATDWNQNCAAVVIDPELECWVWSDSPEVDINIGWSGRTPTLRQWLLAEKLWLADDIKPKDPKLAFERALFRANKAKSAVIFEALGRSVSTKRCGDRAFLKLRGTLCRWFPRS